jgi:hypothetical protein
MFFRDPSGVHWAPPVPGLPWLVPLLPLPLPVEGSQALVELYILIGGLHCQLLVELPQVCLANGVCLTVCRECARIQSDDDAGKPLCKIHCGMNERMNAGPFKSLHCTVSREVMRQQLEGEPRALHTGMHTAGKALRSRASVKKCRSHIAAGVLRTTEPASKGSGWKSAESLACSALHYTYCELAVGHTAMLAISLFPPFFHIISISCCTSITCFKHVCVQPTNTRLRFAHSTTSFAWPHSVCRPAQPCFSIPFLQQQNKFVTCLPMHAQPKQRFIAQDSNVD